ncbi:mucin-19-like [Penaeus chinensis]|uniref:mucin-19-like n=1 Tax=Penaeus chinensis TaxID=139456 RepID=UPI001FB807D7|nr:mucin-19-like [Penaeus chinensis]
MIYKYTQITKALDGHLLQLKVLVVVSLATCLLGAKLPYSASSEEDSATQILSRTVSVKTPERKSSVISHFLPADHIYEATGSVSISKGPSSSRAATPAPAPISAPVAKVPAAPAPKSPVSIARTVSVKTPERKSSVISHFTPADHRYEATGSVVINTGSSGPAKSRPAPVPAPAPPRVVASPPPAPVVPSPSSAAKLSLSRTVSVKTPVRKSSVISHFTPADHRYEATGSVVINQSSGSPARVQKVAAPAPAPVRPAPIPAPAPAPARAAPAPARAVPATSSGSKLALSRTVSVKTPERKSSVISHFTPADHRYEATGSVVINQSSGSSAARVQKVAAPAPAPVRPAPIPAPAPARAAPAPARAAPAISSGSKLALSRTVSVKTPERKSSVISHFTPADHRYEATGSVVINQSSGSAARVQKVAAPAPAPVRPAPIPAPAPARAAPAPARAAPAINSGSKLALSRTVSVKTPERKSSVISHFTPADHRYEATGSVVINQSSGSSAARVQKVAAPAPAPVRPAPIPAPAPARAAPAPARAAPAISSSSKLALSRTVSVKTPERKSSVISHFTPADHRYEATGSVVINQSSGSAARVQKVAAPAPAPVRPAPIPAPAPARAAPAPARAAPAINSGSKLALSRTVSVKTPERISSVISHFTPADHRYEATGSVVINQSSGSSAARVQKVAAPAPAPVRPAPIPAPIPAPARAAPAPARAAPAISSSSKLALSRTVSVKTPERKSSVISHFTPADHRYEATGSVVINQSSGSSQARKTSSSAAQVQKVAIPAQAPAPAPVRPAPSASAQAASAAGSSASKLSLTRTVSVKTPERKSSVISHFTPAEHQYEATGSVIINQASGSSQARKTSSSSAAAAAAVRAQQEAEAARAQQAAAAAARAQQAAEAARAQQAAEAARAQQAAEAARAQQAAAAAARAQQAAEAARAQQAAAAASSASKLSLTRTVSVTTPERESSVISHFTPEDHRYEATGSVVINQGSAGSSRKTSSASFSSQGASSVSSSATGQSSSSSSGSGLASSSGSGLASSSASGFSSSAGASRLVSSSSGSGLSSSASSRKQASQSSSRFSSSSASSGSSSAASSSSSSSAGSRSHSYRLAEPFRGGSSFSSADLMEEMLAFRAEAAKSGVAYPEFRDTGDGSGSDPYAFNVRVEDHENTNYQSRDEWVGEDGITRGWYTVLMPDAFFYNYSYIAHPIKGYQVTVSKTDSGIDMKDVEADIFAPATVFSNQGITRFSDFAISGVNNQDDGPNLNMEFDVNSAALFAQSMAEAMQNPRSSSSSSRPVEVHGPPAHINGFAFVSDHGSSGSSSGSRFVGSSSASSGSSSGSSFTGSRGVSSGSSSGSSFTGSSGISSGSSSGSSFTGSSGISSGSSSGSSFTGSSGISSGSSSGSSFTGSSGVSSGSSSHRFGSSSSSSDSSSSSVSGASSSFSGGQSFSGSFSGSSSSGASAEETQISQSSSGISGASTGSAGSKLSLTRTVSVKTPQRTSGVISHFTPKDHQYEATGSVVINQASKASSSSAARVQKVAVPAPAPVRLAPAPAPARAASAAASSTSNLSLSRTVSVKTPVRESSVISHFTPADHRYEATGSVVINQASGSSRATQASSAARVQKVSAPAPAPVQPAPARPAPVPAPARAASSAAGASKLSLTRTVSVKTPVRESSVISHFTPADHRYEATGSVVINQSSGSSQARKTSSSAARVQKVSAPAPVQPVPVRPAPARPAPAPAPARAVSSAAGASKLSLTRTVSVKTPERKSSVISHFTPADHRYEATGSVVINQSSSQTRKTSSSAAQVQRVPAPAPAPARPAPLPVRAPAPAPARPIPAVAPSDAKLSLTRTISVKTPERKSSVISHFTPADHRYEASGSVTINKSSVGATRPVTPSARVVPSAPAAPAPAAPAPARPAPAASPKPAAASLTRTISVKTPERKSNVISFFVPADHSYDATGSVTINKSS